MVWNLVLLTILIIWNSIISCQIIAWQPGLDESQSGFDMPFRRDLFFCLLDVRRRNWYERAQKTDLKNWPTVGSNRKYVLFCIKNFPKIESIGRSAINFIGFFWKSFTTSRSVEGSWLCYIVLFSIVFFFLEKTKEQNNTGKRMKTSKIKTLRVVYRDLPDWKTYCFILKFSKTKNHENG